MGPFSLDDPKDYSVDVRISDGGRPIQASVTKLAIKVGSAAAWSKKTHENSGRWAQRLWPHTHIKHFWRSKPEMKSSLFLLVVMSVRCRADSHAVQSRSSEDGSERPCPGGHPALHLDHTRWDFCFGLFLFGFDGDLFFKAETVSFSFSRSKKTSVEHRRPLFAPPRQSSSCDSASVLKLLSSKTEDLFLLNLLWICSSRCLLREIKYFGCSRGWERLSVESKRHKRLKSETKKERKKGEILGCGSSKQINSLSVWAWGEAGDEPQPSLPHLNLPTSTKDVWTLLSASLFLPICWSKLNINLRGQLGKLVHMVCFICCDALRRKERGKKGRLGWEFRLCFCSFLKVRLMSRCRVSVNVEHHQQVFCRA